MSDIFSPVRPEDGLDGLSATAWNLMLGVARERAGRQRGPNGNRVGDGFPTPTRILVHNTTAGTLAQWAIVAVGAPTFIPASASEILQRRTAFAATAPTAGGMFAVCQEAIPAGAVGFAVIQGVTPCKLNVTSASDTHAGATTSTTELTTGTSGRAEIIYKASGTGAGKIGVVLIGAPVIADASVIDLDYVSKVCVQQTSGGIVTGITAEHRKVRILGVVLEDETYCSEDDDCCPDIWLDCATERELGVESLPSSLVLRIRGHGDAGCTAIDMCFPLVATNDPSIKYHDHPCRVA